MVHVQAHATLTASQQLLEHCEAVVSMLEMVYMTSLRPNSQDMDLKALPAKVLSNHAESGVVSLSNFSPTSSKLVSVCLCFLRTLSTTLSKTLSATLEARAGSLPPAPTYRHNSTHRACFPLLQLEDPITCAHKTRQEVYAASVDCQAHCACLECIELTCPCSCGFDVINVQLWQTTSQQKWL